MERASRPTTSHRIATEKITRTSTVRLFRAVWFKSSRRIRRCGMPTGMPKADRTSTAKVIRPRPPSWIRIMITASPNTVNVVPTSTVDRPVTVTAEVEIKSAVNSDTGCWTEIGNHKTPPPMRIENRYNNASVAGGGRRNVCNPRRPRALLRATVTGSRRSRADLCVAQAAAANRHLATCNPCYPGPRIPCRA